MPQSLSKNYIHLTFSTKHRLDTIQPCDESDLYAYISGILRQEECPVVAIGGTANHVHILFVLNKNIALFKLVEIAKRGSSKWLKMRHDVYKKFSWQEGYGAFSVSPSKIEVVVRYIQGQKEHHKKYSFKEEYKKFLDESGIEYNEVFLWD